MNRKVLDTRTANRTANRKSLTFDPKTAKIGRNRTAVRCGVVEIQLQCGLLSSNKNSIKELETRTNKSPHKKGGCKRSLFIYCQELGVIRKCGSWEHFLCLL